MTAGELGEEEVADILKKRSWNLKKIEEEDPMYSPECLGGS